jgi:hypothetical protein
MDLNNLRDSGISILCIVGNFHMVLFFIYLLLYVDDMLIASKSMFEVKKMKSLLSDEFEMKDLVGAKKIIGLVSAPYNVHFRL